MLSPGPTVIAVLGVDAGHAGSKRWCQDGQDGCGERCPPGPPDAAAEPVLEAVLERVTYANEETGA